ncbi:ABC transporter permease [Streptomyces europaeiscabiei]|uniref:ABC transporter permease n=1 Tax=Streptomyces europaeiscabiei TaxID=146819 RepID=A0ABU4N9V8_9ACTN|nr:ABC transporter permease [Streptomyces europaeiscabiei]MDX3541285.1 ABC transporter permease [Streptomyces europaeiscabiei]MDX3551626.1 ABC transporter permease [Streptomyces europaeiscabiei]MDX3699865.1 ABC transporter permease [Streptomyces europaeiscabiei]MDX3715623.1 ABC transporter permease [Streptomyces europaeiscabiei]MDX3840349.1 ABC transporter permease [Streptomyces europaeiscabiei]
MSTLANDLRLAVLLTRGSDRREWWRVTLTALGAALATGFGMAAAALASLEGQYSVQFGSGLLNHPGERSGVIVTLLLLLVPVLGFLGQCTRVGALHRDRRLAGLRLAGASATQVRRIAALETAAACLVGSLVVTVFFGLLLLGVWSSPPVLAWVGIALVALGVPALGAVASVLALRRVVASPLGWVRRVRPSTGRGPGWVFLGAVVLVVLGALLAVANTNRDMPDSSPSQAPLTISGALLAVGAGAVWLSGTVSKFTGRLLAARAETPAVLIAAERLRDDPWASARTHAAVLMGTVVGSGFIGIREALLAQVNSTDYLAERSFYVTGLNLVAAAILVGFAITLFGLAVGTAESLSARRRGLAAQVAAGVPYEVLGRALLLETALPLAPSMLVAGAGGTAIAIWYALAVGGVSILPLGALLVPLAVYGACLLAAATSLPLLRRSVRPTELRYA